MELLLAEAERRRTEEHLLPFVQRSWAVVEPDVPFQTNWHHGLICEWLEAVTLGQVRRVIFNIPPRFTKSRIVSVCWPSWEWTRFAERSWIFSSYAEKLSVQHSMERRSILLSPWYLENWGERVRFAADQNLKTEYRNLAGGKMFATSTGGSVMGMGGDRIVVDDPHSLVQAYSELERTAAITYFDQQLTTRGNDPRTVAIVVIMQRLHERDLTGHLLSEKTGWQHVKLPAEAESRETVTYPLSGTVHSRLPGELLWPDRWPKEVLEEKKRDLGSWAYTGQFQQAPSPMGGGIFKRDWWHFYGPAPCPRPGCGQIHGIPTAFDDMLQSWDCTFKEAQDTDFVCGQVWGKHRADYYLLDRVHDRMNFPGTLVAIRGLSAKWPMVLTKLVEDKANGPAVIAVLQHEISGLIPVDPAGGKEARAHAVSPLVEAGNVYLPHPSIAPWIHDFIEEHAAFPRGAHDDDVDAETQALRRLATQPGQGLFDFVREQIQGKTGAAAGPRAAIVEQLR